MIQISDLSVNYKWRQEPVLKGINGTFNDKSLILGPNGSGKTTLFRTICGLTNITSGNIIIDGKRIEDLYAAKGILSTNFPEVYTLIASNVYDVVRLYADLCDGDASMAFKIIEDLGLTPEFLKKHKSNELSAGQSKIVCTAMALAMKTTHVLLDEPFEQLDPAKKSRMIEHLHEYKGIILTNTHETWLLRNLQEWKVFFMFEGYLYGPLSVKELLTSEIVLEDKPKALLKLTVSNKTISILKSNGKGTLLTSLESLDRIYSLAEGS